MSRNKGERRHLALVGVLAACMSSMLMAAEPCAVSYWHDYGHTKLFRNAETKAYAFTVQEVSIDADGAPNAYHPDDILLDCVHGKGFKGLDCPKHAGYPPSLDVLVPDPSSPRTPFVQPSTSAYAGFFVSQTALVDGNQAETDPARYADARVVPYLVFPGRFLQLVGTGLVGDVGYARNLTTGASSPFVVADVGTRDAELGEISIALAEALGGKAPNPRTGGGVPHGDLLFIVFPHSRKAPAWPRTTTEIGEQVDLLLRPLGDAKQLAGCLRHGQKKNAAQP